MHEIKRGPGPASGDIPPTDVDVLISRVSAGDSQALHDLITLVQEELRILARSTRRGWSPPPSLATTELVSEAYLRLFDGAMPAIEGRKHFFCLAARTMRWIVVSHYQSARARPEVGALEPADPDRSTAQSAALHGALAEAGDLTALDEALERLGAVEPELARFVELRFFLGLQMSEVSRVMDVSERTLNRRWGRARAWLYRELRPRDGPGDGPGDEAANREQGTDA
ncbi:MAG: sigma-70 family RNA polymerase sigma factor [bacterium]|nr:sigma-70 family RNA polymerase sigma factor [bacterium]